MTWAAAMIALLSVAATGFADTGPGGGGGTGGGPGPGGTPPPPFALTLEAAPKSQPLNNFQGNPVSFKTTVSNNTPAPLNVTLDWVITIPGLGNPTLPICQNLLTIESQVTIASNSTQGFTPISLPPYWCVSNYIVTLTARDSASNAVLGTAIDSFAMAPATNSGP
jgi:hypothetical protein